MGKSTISMAMLNGKLLNYKKVFPQSTIELVINTIKQP